MKRSRLKFPGLLLALLLLVSLLPLGSISALAEEPGGEIASVGLSLSLPQAGATGVPAGDPVPAAVSIASGSGFSVQNPRWHTAGGSTPESFEVGEQYYATMTLVAETGYSFSENTAVSFDTAETNVVELWSSTRLYVSTGMVTVSGSAVETYGLWVGGVQANAENKGDILGDGSASFDPATNTLTLNEPAISGVQALSGAQILADGFDLTVKGKASLELETADVGIYVLGGSLILEGEFSIKAQSFAILSEKDLTLNEGKISAEVSLPNKTAVQAQGKLLVKQAELTALGTAVGIRADGVFSLEEGVVKASASGKDCDSDLPVYGLMARSDVEIKGGDLTAQGLNDGINAAKGLSISGGIVLAEGGSCGIRAAGKLEIRNGTERVTADGKGEDGAILAGEIVLDSSMGVTDPEKGKVGDDGKHITENDGSTVVSHAVIEAVIPCYTVRFDSLGGSQVPDQTVEEGQCAEEPPKPKLSGFRFDGWYKGEQFSEFYDFSTPITGDLTLKAYWSCTVQASVKDSEGNEGKGGFVALGGDEYQPSLSTYVWRDGGPYQVSCKADKGYVFDHWEDGQGNPLPETATSFSFSVQSGAQAFVAVFLESASGGYTITLDTQGGDPASLTLITDADGLLDPDELAQAEDALSKEGYDLVGWSLTPDGKAVDLETYAFSEDETVYALWSVHYYTVRFEANGGSATPAQSVAHGKTAEEPDDPVKRGSSFEGWYADQALTVPFRFNTPITKDTVLYAKWEDVVKYTVVSGGGSIYGKTSGKELKITVKRTPKDADCFKHFTGVKIDGGELTLGTDYTAEAGSTVITLKPDYLKTLNSGSHIVTITFDDGKATTGLTVKAGTGGGGSKRGSKGDSPETGDPGSPLLWTGMLLGAGLGLGAVVLSGRKLRRAAQK